MIRNIDSLGRIVLPKELRDKLHINAGTLIELSAEDGYILCKKHNHLNKEEIKCQIKKMIENNELEKALKLVDDIFDN